VSAERSAPLSPFERALVQVAQRRDPSRRWHLRVVKPGAQPKATSDRSAKGTARPEDSGA
jgi:hypothetical protein